MDSRFLQEGKYGGRGRRDHFLYQCRTLKMKYLLGNHEQYRLTFDKREEKFKRQAGSMLVYS